MTWKVGKIEHVNIEDLGSSIHLQKEGGRRAVSKGKWAALRACRAVEFLTGRIFRYMEVGEIERKC